MLGYWPIRARAQVARYLLEYSKIHHKEKLYYDMEEWFNKDKPNLHLPLPNLPYLTADGTVVLTESLAIEKYIIEHSKFKHGLLGLESIQK